MARINKEQIEKLAGLAKLEISPAELKELEPQLEDILDYVAKIQSLETTKVRPFSEQAVGLTDSRADERRSFHGPQLLPKDRLERGLLKTPAVFNHGAEKTDN